MSRDPEIDEFRAQIAERDREIVSAINARLQLVRRLKAYKEENRINFLDTRQEQRIHRQLASYNRGPLSEKGLHELVGEILDLMKRELRGVHPEPYGLYLDPDDLSPRQLGLVRRHERGGSVA